MTINVQLLYFITTVTSQIHSARHHQRAGYRASSLTAVVWTGSIVVTSNFIQMKRKAQSCLPCGNLNFVEGQPSFLNVTRFGENVPK